MDRIMSAYETNAKGISRVLSKAFAYLSVTGNGGQAKTNWGALENLEKNELSMPAMGEVSPLIRAIETIDDREFSLPLAAITD